MSISNFVKSCEKRKREICKALTENPDHPDKRDLNKQLADLNRSIYKATRRGIGDESQ